MPSEFHTPIPNIVFLPLLQIYNNGSYSNSEV
jgi:hypothetical protein